MAEKYVTAFYISKFKRYWDSMLGIQYLFYNIAVQYINNKDIISN